MLLFLLVRTAIGVTILVYSSILCENLSLLRNIFRPTAFYSGNYLLQTAKTGFCALIVIWYNVKLQIPSTQPLLAFIHMFGVQLFFVAVGITFLRQSIKRAAVIQHIHKKLLHKKQSLVDVMAEDHGKELAVISK